MMLWSQAFYALFFVAQVFIVTNEAEYRRPVWNIAHMVNAVHQIDNYLDKGANGLEFDLSFSYEGTVKYTFHGFPCDCWRNCMQYEDFTTYLQYLRRLTTPGDPMFRKELVMLFFDFKVAGLPLQAQINAGEDVAKKLLEFYWIGGESETQTYIVVSLPMTKHVEVMKSFLRTLQYYNASEYISRIGLDFSGNENINTIKNCLESVGFHKRNWLGDGVTNCLGRSTYRLRTALKERDEQDEPIDKVYWWTVDRKVTMRRVIRLGVDALITNYPQNLFKILNEARFRQQVRLATFEDSPWKTYIPDIEMSNSFQEENSTFYDRLEKEEILYN